MGRWCKSHCWVWHVDRAEGGETLISLGCAHCDAERLRWVAVDLVGDAERAAYSAHLHSVRCRRPARLPRLDLLGA